MAAQDARLEVESDNVDEALKICRENDLGHATVALVRAESALNEAHSYLEMYEDGKL
jgi:cellobiose-specific phosphotransferase system component IIA